MSPQWVPLPRSKITVCPSDYDHFVWTESLSGASSTLWLYSCCVNSIYLLNSNSSNSCVCPLNVCVMGINLSTLVAVLPMEKSTLVSTISCLDLWKRCHRSSHLSTHLEVAEVEVLSPNAVWWVSGAGESLSVSVTWMFRYVRNYIHTMNNLSSVCNVSCCPWVEHGFPSRGKYVGVSPYTNISKHVNIK